MYVGHPFWGAITGRIILIIMVMSAKPARWLVSLCLVAAGVAMAGAVYFGGTGRIPLAMIGTVLFITFGGLGFELARRRSV
jgi:hypothetical protein